MNNEKRYHNPRVAAHASLLAWEKNKRYANLEVNALLARADMNEADRGLYTALVYGVIERAVTLDYVIEHLSSRPIRDMDESTRCALRLGLYQLKFMDRIPPHAAVSETVELVSPKAKGFVNALLRTFQRSGCEIPLPPKNDTVARLSVECSAPQELCRFWLARYSPELTRALLASTVRNPAVTVRVNPLKTTVKEMLERLPEASVHPLANDMLILPHAAHIAADIQAGLYFVQDVASRLCIRALDPQAGETVIDTCAAPGGKTISIAFDMENRGTVYAFDLHKNKLSLIERTAQSMGISILKAQARDARTPDSALLGMADRVLCDAPCSGLGVIGKKPDIKYKPISQIEGLPAAQYDILCGASEYVRLGGVLVYSTCTLNPDENEEIVRKFTNSHPDFVLTPFDLGAAGVSANGMRTFYPHIDGCDGFFIAKMTRKK